MKDEETSGGYTDTNQSQGKIGGSPVGGAATGAATARAPEVNSSQPVGATFVRWFNKQLMKAPNASIEIEGRDVKITRLTLDGQLEIDRASGSSVQFVPFEEKYLDELMPEIAHL